MLIALTLSGFTIGWIGYAFLSGRNLKQRLTEPAPIPSPGEAVTT
jgi:hypothetical protein